MPRPHPRALHLNGKGHPVPLGQTTLFNLVLVEENVASAPSNQVASAGLLSLLGARLWKMKWVSGQDWPRKKSIPTTNPQVIRMQ